ncbi:hypothetical protein Nos7107_4790 [Nostoc sp. PCC 7107]|nr:hypothetical protein [Nostoc sp. PCC 7107]AFY45309.1 hypothetical protein Nos7107_4790 [Nostoc sp. PCC 7107]
MWEDEIVKEIHQIREAYAKSFNYDLDAIFADLRKKETESGRKIVSLSRRRGLITRWSGRASDLGRDTEDTSHRST